MREFGVPAQPAADTFADMDAALRQGLGDKDAKVFLKQQLDRAGATITVERRLVAEAAEEARRRF